MRTVKTGLAVLVCMIVYFFTNKYELTTNFDAFLGVTAAIICMQDSVKTSVTMGISRLQGTVVGAVLGMLVLMLDQVLHYELLYVATFVAGIILLILICNILDINKAIVMGCIVFCIITLQQTQSGPIFASAQRFLDTAVGIVISVAINHFIHNPDKNADDESTDEE